MTPDGDLIVAETHALRLTRLPAEGPGRLGRPSVFADLGTDALGGGRKAFPDGICLDAAGAVWVGTAISGSYLRVEEGGTVTDVVEPAAAWATACMLGGPDGRSLFLATCNGSLDALGQFRHRSMDQEGDRHEYMAWATGLSQGFVEVVEVSVPHAGLP
jgi:sugar lactone lactonase YvrE